MGERRRAGGRKAAALFGCLLLGAGAATAQPGGQKDGEESVARMRRMADERLREMSDYLGGLKSFTFVADTSTEVVLESGQKLEFDASSRLAVQRPHRIRSDRVGEVAELSFYYDGRTLTLFGRGLELYASAPAPEDIDQTIDFARDRLGLDLPGADLLTSDVHALFTKDADSMIYVGRTMVGGVPCHHLAFRGEEVDWQLWIAEGPRPLPRKYLITSKKVEGSPEFTVQLRDWDLDPELSEELFTFHPPPGAERIDFKGLSQGQQRPGEGK